MVLIGETAPAAARVRRRSGGGRKDWRLRFVGKPVVFIVCLLPAAWLASAWATASLGANPIEATNRFLGDWALRFLLITLAVSPIKALSGWAGVMRFRRMLGLYAFFYAVLHLASYVGLDQFFAWKEIAADIIKRNYITVGMLAFALLLPLAVTSTKGWIKRLGAGRWQRLHRLVYPAAMLACLHFYMMVKADVREPLIYAALLALLFAFRLRRRPQRLAPPSPTATAEAKV